jgi:hypothetical protein
MSHSTININKITFSKDNLRFPLSFKSSFFMKSEVDLAIGRKSILFELTSVESKKVF